MSDMQEEILYVLKHIVIGRASRLTPREADKLLNYITNLQEKNKKLKDLCDKYEEEHNTTFIEWQKDIKVNKKAIEYIEKYVSYYDMEGDLRNRLLNILKGDNK